MSFRDPSVHPPFNRQSSFSLIPFPPSLHHSHTKHKISIFFSTVIAWFLIPRTPSSQDWSCSQILGRGGHPGTVGERRFRSGRGADLGGLEAEPGSKRRSLKVVCFAMIKSKKLKRLSLQLPSWVICSALGGRPAGAWIGRNVAKDEENAADTEWSRLGTRQLCGHSQKQPNTTERTEHAGKTNTA